MSKRPQNGESAGRRGEVVRSDAENILDRERLGQGLVAWGFNGRFVGQSGEEYIGRGNIAER